LETIRRRPADGVVAPVFAAGSDYDRSIAAERIGAAEGSTGQVPEAGHHAIHPAKRLAPAVRGALTDDHGSIATGRSETDQRRDRVGVP